MKTSKTIYALLILAMCSCSGATPEKQDTAQAKVKAEAKTNEAKTIEAKAITSEPGIVFYDIPLETALEKANLEGKYVLIDCKTKNCGPCRRMEKEVFPQEKLGKFVNEHFVLIMSDMGEEGEGKSIAEKYTIQINPTLLVLRPDASKKGEIIGAEYNIDALIEMLKKILHEK